MANGIFRPCLMALLHLKESPLTGWVYQFFLNIAHNTSNYVFSLFFHKTSQCLISIMPRSS